MFAVLPVSRKGCVKVTTGGGKHDAGYLTVYVDQDTGSGFEAATDEGGRYGNGATVLDQCYDNLKALQVQNMKNDGWIGSVTFARDKDADYVAGYCGGDTCAKPGGTDRILVDGDDGVSSTACQNKKMCDITFDLDGVGGMPQASGSTASEGAGAGASGGGNTGTSDVAANATLVG